MDNVPARYTAFVGTRRLAAGELRDVLPHLKAQFDKSRGEPLLVFDDRTGNQVDFDLRGSAAEVLARAVPQAVRRPGRPRLGVVSREVSLLPRHWQWLEEQPSGISAALRRLVDQARKAAPGREHGRQLRAAASRIMTALAGNLPGYEEASRALFAHDQRRFEELVASWPADVRDHLVGMTREATRAEESDPPA